jgi:hypothetical protein
MAAGTGSPEDLPGDDVRDLDMGNVPDSEVLDERRSCIDGRA